MAYPPQLDPVQAWLLGYIDSATLRDVIGAAEAIAVGRVQADEAYASRLIAEAQAALGEVPE
jgi:hypothetical protein